MAGMGTGEYETLSTQTILLEPTSYSYEVSIKRRIGQRKAFLEIARLVSAANTRRKNKYVQIPQLCWKEVLHTAAHLCREHEERKQ
ncbi:MAG: hypothetical protein V1676_03855 [Candidatus Diapherotrites archaeon]